MRRRRVAAIAATATLLVLDADPPGSVTEWTGIAKPVSHIGLDSLVTLVPLLPVVTRLSSPAPDRQFARRPLSATRAS